MSTPLALTAISGGINRLRTKGGADKNSLFDLLNGYVTQAGTVKVREGTYRNANIGAYSGAGNTKGLMAYQGQLHVFSNTVVPVPPGYALHVLGYPFRSPLTDTITVIPPTGDPSFADVALLLHYDGLQIVDASSHSLPMTLTGATTENTQVKFGTGALNLPFTASAYASTPVTAGSPLDLGATQQDWTLECFVKLSISGNPTGPGLELMGAKDIQTNPAYPSLVASTSGGIIFITALIFGALAGQPIAANTWTHVAHTRRNNTYTLWINGVNVVSVVGASAVTAGMVPFFTGPFHHSAINDNSVVGFMDEVRVTNGLARYTANFTPPTAPFPGNTTVAAPPTIKEIHFSAPYLGGIYVVATFNITDPTVLAQYGDTFHYWIQSSTGGDNSNAWTKNTDYMIGDVVIPTTENGLTYVASRRYPANPVWAANVGETVGNIVEPTVANGFKYTATAVLGAKPTTGFTEPTWPTEDGAIVNENSAIASDQTVTRVQPASNTPTPAPPSRYSGGIAGGFGQSPS